MKCWEWDGALAHGYGRTKIGGKVMLVHRVVYEEIIGTIPSGLEIDHLCRNTKCYNPEHLEAVTHAENLRRGIGHGNETHCPKGHPYSGDNLIIGKHGKGNGHHRQCKICKYAQARAFYHRRKANV